MTELNTQREQKKIQELARDYEEKGFRVSVLPRGKSVPAFLRNLDFSPDLLAESESESHVIEVSSRDTAERLRELSEVVEAIEKKRGWSFILVMTNPRVSRVAPETPEVPQIHQLQYAFDNLRELASVSSPSDNQFAHAILLAGWSIVEGALRMYLDSNRPKRRIRTPSSLVRDAVMYGFLDSEEGDFLTSVAQLRNAVAHGAVNTRVAKKTISRLMKVCESLVSERGSDD